MSVHGLPIAESEAHFLTRAQVAERLGVSVSTVKRMEQRGLPSMLMLARTRRFHWPTVAAWVFSHQGGQEAA